MVGKVRDLEEENEYLGKRVQKLEQKVEEKDELYQLKNDLNLMK